MPLDTAALATIIAIVIVVGVKIITGSALNSTRRDLVRLRDRRGELMVELDHAQERKKASTGTLAFYEQRKMEVEDQIRFTQADLETEKAMSGEEKSKDKTVGLHNPSKDLARGYQQ